MKTLALALMLAAAPLAHAQDAPPEPAPIAELVGIDGVQPAGPPPSDAAADEITVEIARELRCPVCQGLSVADSKTETSIAMFDRIHELVRLGYSEEQIDQYFIDRYGDWVLLAPRARGLAVLLWVLPVAFIAAIVLGMFTLTRRRVDRPPTGQAEATHTSDPYLDKVMQDLENR